MDKMIMKENRPFLLAAHWRRARCIRCSFACYCTMPWKSRRGRRRWKQTTRTTNRPADSYSSAHPVADLIASFVNYKLWKATRAARMVFSISADVCAVERKAASNCEGAK